MSIWSLTYQQSVFKRYHSDIHLSEFYLQAGGENQLAYKINVASSWDMEIGLNSLGWTCHTQAEPSCDMFNLGSSYFHVPQIPNYRVSYVLSYDQPLA